MARSGGRGFVSREALGRFKYEIADELGLTAKVSDKGWAEMTSRECGAVGGRIGGNMVRVMVRYAEDALGKGETIE